MKQIHIAVAEDNPMDLVWLKMVLDELSLDYTLTIALDGEEALNFILKRGRYQNVPPADLIFLDMNMPKFTGLEVLRQIPRSAELPVCVLTSSQHEQRMIEEHFAPRKVKYLTKPVTRANVLQCMRCLDLLAEPHADLN